MDLERQVFAWRFVQLHARCKQKEGKGKIRRSRSTSETRRHSKKETEHEIPKGKAPKVPVRQEN